MRACVRACVRVCVCVFCLSKLNYILENMENLNRCMSIKQAKLIVNAHKVFVVAAAAGVQIAGDL